MFKQYIFILLFLIIGLFQVLAYVPKQDVIHGGVYRYMNCTASKALFTVDSTVTLPLNNISQDSQFRKAWLYSTILPGLGQAYNKKYWKIPIIYMSFIGLGIGINYCHKQYLAYRRDLFKKMDTNKSDYNLEEGQLRYQTSLYRKDRDMMIFIVALFYLFNIIDAYVDAHLNTFDLSDNLSVNIHSSLECFDFFQNSTIYNGFGITIQYKL